MPQTYMRNSITRIVRTGYPIMKLSMCRADKSVQGYPNVAGNNPRGLCNNMAMSVDSGPWKFLSWRRRLLVRLRLCFAACMAGGFAAFREVTGLFYAWVWIIGVFW